MHLTWREPFLCALAFAMMAPPFAPESRAAQSEPQKLIELEREWNAALHRRDVGFIGKVLAEEFVVITADGQRGTRAQELALAAEFNQQIDSTTLDEFTVKIYGNTAIVWFTEHLVGPKQGRPTAVTYRYTDVFVRRAGRWQCVASQGTRVAS
jgi:ketosteroid isomerase-like protein